MEGDVNTNKTRTQSLRQFVSPLMVVWNYSLILSFCFAKDPSCHWEDRRKQCFQCWMTGAWKHVLSGIGVPHPISITQTSEGPHLICSIKECPHITGPLREKRDLKAGFRTLGLLGPGILIQESGARQLSDSFSPLKLCLGVQLRQVRSLW